MLRIACGTLCAVRPALRPPASTNLVPDWLAGSVLELGTPRVGDNLGHAVGHRRVIELGCHLLTAFERPVEEFQYLGGILRLVLLLVHQDKARTGDRPTRLPRLVGKNLIKTRRVFPVGV